MLDRAAAQGQLRTEAKRYMESPGLDPESLSTGHSDLCLSYTCSSFWKQNYVSLRKTLPCWQP